MNTLEYHNPENVTPEQVGEGWRLCLKSEVGNPPKDAQMWRYDRTWWGSRGKRAGSPLSSRATYRTRAPLPTVQPQSEENFHCNPDPVDPYAELKAAHAAGKMIQIRSSFLKDQWNDLPLPSWDEAPLCYRVKPEESVSVTQDIPEGCLPFDLEKAKDGAPLITRDGREAKFIAHVPDAAFAEEKIVCLCGGTIGCRYESGRSSVSVNKESDLFLRAPRKVKREGWIVLPWKRRNSYGLPIGVAPTKEEALVGGAGGYAARVEWEEDENPQA